MKLPICYFDAKTKILCPTCMEKLERGEITQLDVDLAHDFVELEEKEFPQLKHAEFHRAIRIDNVTFIIVKSSSEITETIWRKIARKLARTYGRVRIIEKTDDKKQMIQKIVFPARVIGINIVYYPDGTSEHYVRIPARDFKKLPYPAQVIEKAIEQITGIKAKIISERI